MFSSLPLPLSGLLVSLLTSSLASADDFSHNYNAYNKAEYGKRPSQTFVSNPNIIAPLLQVNVWDEERISSTGGSHIFLRHDTKDNSSPMILDASDLSLVYMNHSFDRTSDVRMQRFQDRSYLTFYSGTIVDGHGAGESLLIDDHYNNAYNVKVNVSSKNDLHEFQFTDDGKALITTYPSFRKDLSPWRGSRRGKLLDGVFQEVDIATNNVTFEWRASDHVDPADSFYRMEHKWDFFHINSLQKSKEGNYLVSGRHMHSLYLINGTTGDIIWTLGGKQNQFTELDAGNASQSGDSLLSFAWQHHARFYRGNESEITFFDNHALTTKHDCKEDCSRGVHIAIDTQTMTVQLLHEYRHPQSLQAQSQGSVQPLEDDSGNVFVGWGRCPSFTEHTADGQAVMDVQFSPWHSKEDPDALDNYRAYRMDWKAQPDTDPDVMSMEKDGVTTLYASWNGATEVKAWAFLASDESRDLYGPEKVLAIVPRDGFETSWGMYEQRARFARAAALDSEWNVLGSTGIVDVDIGRVFSDVAPVSSVKKEGDVLFSDNGYSMSVLEGPSQSHPDFPGESMVFGMPIGWQTFLGLCILVALYFAARVI